VVLAVAPALRAGQTMMQFGCAVAKACFAVAACRPL
jgi:hypothetical protein